VRPSYSLRLPYRLMVRSGKGRAVLTPEI
jgi:hypothetical protein